MKRATRIRRTTLDRGTAPDDDYRDLTPGERLQIVEELTRTAWALRTGKPGEPRLDRDIGRVIRRT